MLPHLSTLKHMARATAYNNDGYVGCAGVPDRDADQGLHRGGARARAPRRAAARAPRAARLLTPARLVPVLPRRAHALARANTHTHTHTHINARARVNTCR